MMNDHDDIADAQALLTFAISDTIRKCKRQMVDDNDGRHVAMALFTTQLFNHARSNRVLGVRLGGEELIDSLMDYLSDIAEAHRRLPEALRKEAHLSQIDMAVEGSDRAVMV